MYNNLFRLHKAPPIITHTLPNECPILNAQSRILDRRQTDDELCQNYYVVSIKHLSNHTSSNKGGRSDVAHGEVIKHVDVSRIMHYVSPRELERFENAEFRAEAEAEATARQAENEELARRRLAKNVVVATMGRGSRMLNGLESTKALAPRPRGRPRGQGRGQP